MDSIGEEETDQAYSLPKNWYKLLSSSSNSEQAILDMLNICGCKVEAAGSRFERYDLKILQDEKNLIYGKYEIKSLSKSGNSFDRRFKIGSRSEDVYGYYDAIIKSIALPLHDKELTDEQRNLVNQAIKRKHGKNFYENFSKILNDESLKIDKNLIEKYHNFKINDCDISFAFSDIDGIFIVAGTNYTLIHPYYFKSLIQFDSVSCEGVKLRYTGDLPNKNVLKLTKSKDKTNKGKRGKK